MTIEDLRNFDLNLLVTLFVLCEEQNVTLAAKRLGLSQSATSHALGRLRDYFDDPLFVRSDGGMKPTTLTETLRPQVNILVGDLNDLMTKRSSFEAANSVRKFQLASPDVVGAVLAPIATWFENEAPRAGFRLRLLPSDVIHQLTSRGLDLLISPRGSIAAASISARGLGQVRMVSYVRDGHAFGSAVDFEEWSSGRHIVTLLNDGSPSAIQMELDAMERSCKFMEVPNFMTALATVVETDAVFTGPDFMIDYASRMFGLRAVRCPLEIPAIDMALYWHERWNGDEAHAWFRNGIADIVGEQLRQGQIGFEALND